MINPTIKTSAVFQPILNNRFTNIIFLQTYSKFYRNTVFNKPINAPPVISQVELILNRTSKIKEITKMRIVKGSVIEERPNCQVTAAIRLSAAALIPSNKPLAHGELRMRGINGLEMATKIKEGKKMPRVARRAPFTPPRIYPINVAVVNKGPGETC